MRSARRSLPRCCREAEAEPMTMPSQMLPVFAVLPELLLAVGAMALLMVGAFRGNRATHIVSELAIGLLAAAALMVATFPAGKFAAFGGSFIVDDFARFLKILALIGSAATIIMSFDYVARRKQRRFEYPILILLSSAGMMMLISAGDLIALYLGLELMSLCLYVLA